MGSTAALVCMAGRTSYTWTGPNGQDISTDGTISVTFSESGDYGIYTCSSSSGLGVRRATIEVERSGSSRGEAASILPFTVAGIAATCILVLLLATFSVIVWHRRRIKVLDLPIHKKKSSTHSKRTDSKSQHGKKSSRHSLGEKASRHGKASRHSLGKKESHHRKKDKKKQKRESLYSDEYPDGADDQAYDQDDAYQDDQDDAYQDDQDNEYQDDGYQDGGYIQDDSQYDNQGDGDYPEDQNSEYLTDEEFDGDEFNEGYYQDEEYDYQDEQ